MRAYMAWRGQEDGFPIMCAPLCAYVIMDEWLDGRVDGSGLFRDWCDCVLLFRSDVAWLVVRLRWNA